MSVNNDVRKERIRGVYELGEIFTEVASNKIKLEEQQKKYKDAKHKKGNNYNEIVCEGGGGEDGAWGELGAKQKIEEALLKSYLASAKTEDEKVAAEAALRAHRGEI
eukprot:GHVR01018007.1.p1 GENE.GHVR01018007.1~~GHVR01018007.1.p1  ORF type:complete len:107 (-),score=43.64 GHVR01018007.1:183-503(-)